MAATKIVSRLADKVRSGLPLTRELAVLSIAGFVTTLGIGILAPTLPLFARSFGVGNASTAAVISAFALARLVCGLLVGRLSNRVGAQRVMLWGLGILAVSSALAGWSNSYLMLLTMRAIGGVGSAMFSVSGLTLVARHAPASGRARATGTYIGALLLGAAFGPAAGIPFAAISVRAPLFGYAVMAGISLAIVYFGLSRKGSRTSVPSSDQEAVSLREALRKRSYRAVVGVNFASTWALGVRSSLIPLYMIERLHERPELVGVALFSSAATNVIVLPPSGKLADRNGRRPVLLTGCAIAFIGLLLIACLPNTVSLFIGLFLFGAGAGIIEPPSGAVLADVSVGKNNMPVALYSMAGDMGMILGPLAMGALVDALSFTWAFTATAVVMAAALALVSRMPSVRPQQSRQSP
ncbi:MFS transporter [Streptomyces sp. NPDC051662]|uniref:MFS transporter n=1 Tax=Streptomyces sp. NPDC051662 TaxID=3154750 RepID=UPI003413F7B7